MHIMDIYIYMFCWSGFLWNCFKTIGPAKLWWWIIIVIVKCVWYYTPFSGHQNDWMQIHKRKVFDASNGHEGFDRHQNHHSMGPWSPKKNLDLRRIDQTFRICWDMILIWMVGGDPGAIPMPINGLGRSGSRFQDTPEQELSGRDQAGCKQT